MSNYLHNDLLILGCVDQQVTGKVSWTPEDKIIFCNPGNLACMGFLWYAFRNANLQMTEIHRSY